MQWPKYRWDGKTHRYRDAKGRFVPRKEIRIALDDAIKVAKGRVSQVALDLQAGKINLPEWQIRMERELKGIHVMATALAAGGWDRVTARDWSKAANLIKSEYKYLAKFAKELKNGLPLDGRFLVRAEMYANAGHGTYENMLRKIELATGQVARERRWRHSNHSCDPCIEYEEMGWQLPGVLPDIRQECDCLSNCLCTFEREYDYAGA